MTQPTTVVPLDPCDPNGYRCDECGTCINHDGCADSQHPLAEGDCAACGACADCIAACNGHADAAEVQP